MIPPPEQGGGAPPPPDNPPPDEQGPTELGRELPALENPLSEEIRYMADGIGAQLGERLRTALGEALGPRRELSLYARINPVTVRAAEPAAKLSAGRLELPEATPQRLGGEIETQVVADGERVRVWLAGTDRIEPGSTVALVAITPEGDTVETTAIAGSTSGVIELSLAWEFPLAPEAVGLGIEQLR